MLIGNTEDVAMGVGPGKRKRFVGSGCAGADDAPAFLKRPSSSASAAYLSPVAAL